MPLNFVVYAAILVSICNEHGVMFGFYSFSTSEKDYFLAYLEGRSCMSVIMHNKSHYSEIGSGLLVLYAILVRGVTKGIKVMMGLPNRAFVK